MNSDRNNYLCIEMTNKYHRFFTKGGLLMCVLNVLSNFISNGAKTLREAAQGQYTYESESIRAIREEVFGQDMSDADKVRQDWRMIGYDAHAAVEKYLLAHE